MRRWSNGYDNGLPSHLSGFELCEGSKLRFESPGRRILSLKTKTLIKPFYFY